MDFIIIVGSLLVVVGIVFYVIKRYVKNVDHLDTPHAAAESSPVTTSTDHTVTQMPEPTKLDVFGLDWDTTADLATKRDYVSKLLAQGITADQLKQKIAEIDPANANQAVYDALGITSSVKPATEPAAKPASTEKKKSNTRGGSRKPAASPATKKPTGTAATAAKPAKKSTTASKKPASVATATTTTTNNSKKKPRNKK